MFEAKWRKVKRLAASSKHQVCLCIKKGGICACTLCGCQREISILYDEGSELVGEQHCDCVLTYAWLVLLHEEEEVMEPDPIMIS